MSQAQSLAPHAAAFPYDIGFVRIPADDSEPLEDLVQTVTEPGDALTTLLAPRFAVVDPATLDLAPLRQQFGGEAIESKLEQIRQLAVAGTVGVVPLVRPSHSTVPMKHTGTFLYHDDMGLLKALPPNRRARALAEACGCTLDHPIPGDVFVGRVCVHPPPMRAASILRTEVDPTVGESFAGQEWLSRAPEENERATKSLSELQATAQSTAKPGEAPLASGARPWRWRQSSDDVEVVVTLPEGATKRDVAATIGADGLSVALRGREAPLVELKFPPGVACRPDESTWALEADDVRGSHVLLTLAKARPGVPWPVLAAGGALYEADSVCDVDVD
jgi:hypothetical protein